MRRDRTEHPNQLRKPHPPCHPRVEEEAAVPDIVGLAWMLVMSQNLTPNMAGEWMVPKKWSFLHMFHRFWTCFHIVAKHLPTQRPPVPTLVPHLAVELSRADEVVWVVEVAEVVVVVVVSYTDALLYWMVGKLDS